MHFSERDAVSIHTLVSAGHQVLADLGKRAGCPGMVRNPAIAKPGRAKELRRWIAGPENYFKHADQDPDGVIKFTPFLTEGFLLDAVGIHRYLTRTVIWEFGLFSLWFSSKYPDLIHDSSYKDEIVAKAGKGIPDPDSRAIWLQLVEVNPGGRLDPASQGDATDRPSADR